MAKFINMLGNDSSIRKIRYNQKEYLNAESFLQTAFGEWFSGKKENIAKNYSMLPKDSLVSKDGVEADLEGLRSSLRKSHTSILI